MTRQEFKAGWRLLILQPWGWRYNQARDGQPTPEAVAQFDLYYDALKAWHPDAWHAVARMYAEGEKWPSVGELRTSLALEQARHVPALPDRSRQQGVPMPDDVREKLARLGVVL